MTFFCLDLTKTFCFILLKKELITILSTSVQVPATCLIHFVWEKGSSSMQATHLRFVVKCLEGNPSCSREFHQSTANRGEYLDFQCSCDECTCFSAVFHYSCACLSLQPSS